VTGFLLGVDAGQTATKAVLFDLAGHAVAVGSTRCPTVNPNPRWVERDMDDVWAAAADAIRQCIVDAPAVAHTVRVDRRFTHDPLGAQRFDDIYARYRQSVQALA
jgi:sugar (pentulose or hexulose) kinase